MNKIMTHLVAGYPSLKMTEALTLAMVESGVSFIEIQIPFSDPVADGPTISIANKVALDNGTTPKDAFKLMHRLKAKGVKIPLLFMTYYNILFAYGLEKFCKDAKAAGVYGFIVPDIPPDEEPNEHYLAICKKYGLHAIQIVSPLTSRQRMKEIAQVASGFIYCVSTTGKTGARGTLDMDAIRYVDTLRKYTKLPLALGFGISNRQQVEQALEKADIAVIGSKLIQVFDAAKPSQAQDAVKKFLKEIL